MIILTQNKKKYINFDNVNVMAFNDGYSDKEVNIIVHFADGKSEIIGRFIDAEFGQEVFQDLMMDYRGNAIVEVPKDKVKLWKITGTH